MKLPPYRLSQKNYIFCNVNPKQALRSGDCTFRAISKATGKTWEQVYTELCAIGLEIKDAPNCKPVFNEWFKRNGYKMQRKPKHPDGTHYTAEEFAKEYNQGTYVLNLPAHNTCVIDGKIYDTWNCSRCDVGNYWKIK